MNFEIKIQYNKNVNGQLKKVTEPFIVEAETFGHAETRAYEEMEKLSQAVLEIKSISRKEYEHIFTEAGGEYWHLVKGEYDDIDDKKAKPQYLIQANDPKEAINKIADAIDITGFEITYSEKTKIADVFLIEE
jgi:hypothetical protein